MRFINQLINQLTTGGTTLQATNSVLGQGLFHTRLFNSKREIYDTHTGLLIHVLSSYFPHVFNQLHSAKRKTPYLFPFPILYIYKYTYIYIYTHHTHTYIYIYIYITHTHTHIYIYIYTHIYPHQWATFLPPRSSPQIHSDRPPPRNSTWRGPRG